MKTLAVSDLALIHAGGDSAVVDLGQFIGAYSKSLLENAYFGPLTGTVAFFEAMAYALKD
ncbi:MAG TPA: hypothetical protein PKX00_07890 [Opitutaceae bacterium]|jgi:hypothetical protein|nr:hypothetical protein [Opitutaceae bacterium]